MEKLMTPEIEYILKAVGTCVLFFLVISFVVVKIVIKIVKDYEDWKDGPD
jgi:hypothetical protein